MNGDGRDDVIMGYNTNPPLEVFLQGESGFEITSSTETYCNYKLQVAGMASTVIIADANGDGRQDVFAVMEIDKRIGVFLGR